MEQPPTERARVPDALPRKTIVLVGLMGAGKTSVGKRLAAALGLPFRDGDDEIEKSAGLTVPEIFELYGEERFREGERRVMQRLLNAPPHVLATGGGAFMDPETRAAVKEQGAGRVLAVLEPRSNTMRMGSHAQELARSLRDADRCYVYARPDLKWDAKGALADVGERLHVEQTLEPLIAAIAADARAGDRIVVMSNGDFGGIHGKLVAALAATA